MTGCVDEPQPVMGYGFDSYRFDPDITLEVSPDIKPKQITIVGVPV